MPEVLPGHLPGDLEGIWMGFCPGLWMGFCPGTWMGLCLGTDLDMGFYNASIKPGSQTEQRQNLQTGTKI